MEPDDIAAVVDGFGAAARQRPRADCDGVEINAGQHSLVRQFLSGLTNQRGDEWGTDRLRFARDVVTTVRGAVGRRPRRRAAAVVRRAGAVGRHHAGDGAGDRRRARRRRCRLRRGRSRRDLLDRADPARLPPADRASTSRSPRPSPKAVDVPVVVQGSIVDVGQAEWALGGYDDPAKCAAVEMTRAQIADPDLVAKLRAGTPEQVRPCTRCNQTCQVRDARNPLVTCIGEPTSGRETEDPDWYSPDAGRQRRHRRRRRTGRPGDGARRRAARASRDARRTARRARRARRRRRPERFARRLAGGRGRPARRRRCGPARRRSRPAGASCSAPAAGRHPRVRRGRRRGRRRRRRPPARHRRHARATATSCCSTRSAARSPSPSPRSSAGGPCSSPRTTSPATSCPAPATSLRPTCAWPRPACASSGAACCAPSGADGATLRDKYTGADRLVPCVAARRLRLPPPGRAAARRRRRGRRLRRAAHGPRGHPRGPPRRPALWPAQSRFRRVRPAWRDEVVSEVGDVSPGSRRGRCGRPAGRPCRGRRRRAGSTPSRGRPPGSACARGGGRGPAGSRAGASRTIPPVMSPPMQLAL